MKMDLRGICGDTTSVLFAGGRDLIVNNRSSFHSNPCCVHDHYHIISSNSLRCADKARIFKYLIYGIFFQIKGRGTKKIK